ncbi:extracellular solute-binding protein [Chloroflexi bacterium TSY]|nr:extracellular solute-binding protein [Chloroflexi bacterium TSY]
MNKTYLGLLLISIILLGACAAPIGPTQSEAPASEGETASDAEQIELVYSVFETPVLTAEFWDEAIADALTQLPDNVTVKKIVSPGIDRTTYAKQLLASGQLPDILESIATQEFIDAGILTEWDPEWIEENFQIPYGSALGGKIWHAPTGAQIIPFWFYNKEIFADVGVEPPTTWAEFQDVVAKIADAGHKPIMVVGAGDAWATGMLVSSLISADVLGDTPDWMQKRRAGEVRFTDADMAGAWEKFAWMVENGYVDQGDLGIGYADANRAFAAGEVAMYPMGSWFLQQAGKEATFEPGIFVMPREDGKVVVPFVVGGGTHISSQTKHPEEAMAFAKAFSVSTKSIAALIELDSYIPLLKGKTLEDYGVEVTSLMEEGLTYTSIEGAIQVEGFGWTTSDNAPIAGMFDEFNKSAQSIITGADWQTEVERLDQVWDSLSEQ